MICRIDEMKNKQVVCVKDGCVLGYVSDIELDTEKGVLTSIVIYGRLRFFGLFGREEDIVIPYDEIKVIGSETVLVSSTVNLSLRDKRSKTRFTSL
ncbi:MAG: YlmC/YmxH family sporulation protein [Clostridia bacterium]|nr:YlmC/YmxH family sporulation protein [Clostridia bacterium]